MFIFNLPSILLCVLNFQTVWLSKYIKQITFLQYGSFQISSPKLDSRYNLSSINTNLSLPKLLQGDTVKHDSTFFNP